MQYEGAVKEDGRGPTVWDTFSHTFGKYIYIYIGYKSKYIIIAYIDNQHVNDILNHIFYRWFQIKPYNFKKFQIKL
jgi:hypothetical protein